MQKGSLYVTVTNGIELWMEHAFFALCGLLPHLIISCRSSGFASSNWNFLPSHGICSSPCDLLPFIGIGLPFCSVCFLHPTSLNITHLYNFPILHCMLSLGVRPSWELTIQYRGQQGHYCQPLCIDWQVCHSIDIQHWLVY